MNLFPVMIFAFVIVISVNGELEGFNGNDMSNVALDQTARRGYLSFLCNDRDVNAVLFLHWQLVTQYSTPYQHIVVVHNGTNGVSTQVIKLLIKQRIIVKEYDFEEELHKRGIDPKRVQNLFENLETKKQIGMSVWRTYPYSILTKLMIFDVGAGKFDALLYLDADMLLNESLDQLLEGNGVGWSGAQLTSPLEGEIHIASDTHILTTAKDHEISLSKNNFNSAVMLFKPSKLLLDASFEVLQSLLDRKYGWLCDTVLGDQDVINIMFWHNKNIRAVRLEHGYNVYAHLAEPLLQHGVIQKERVTHFATGHKPWQLLQSPGSVETKRLQSYGQIRRILRWYTFYAEFTISSAFTASPDNQHFLVFEKVSQSFFSRNDDFKKLIKSPNNYDGYEIVDISPCDNLLSTPQLEYQIYSRIQSHPLPYPESHILRGRLYFFLLLQSPGIMSIVETKKDSCMISQAAEGKHPLSAEQISHFHREGYLIVKGLYSNEDLNAAEEACKSLVDNEALKLLKDGKVSNLMEDRPFKTRLYELYKNEMTSVPALFRKELFNKKGFAHVFCNEKVISAVEQLMNGARERPENELKIRLFPNATCRPKMPFSPIHQVTWHQDAGLRPDGGPNNAPEEERLCSFGPASMINCWMPLVDADRENGCMRIIPQSHKQGCVKHQIVGKYRDNQRLAYSKEKDVSVIEQSDDVNLPPGTYSTGIEPSIIEKCEDQFLWAEAERGDVIFFTNLTFHKGGENRTDHIRWSFDWRYQDASKPTHRPENGHLVSDTRTKNNWTNLKLE
eukprot:g1811.t1